MPIKGIVLLFLIAITIAVSYREQIYKHIKNFFENER